MFSKPFIDPIVPCTVHDNLRRMCTVYDVMLDTCIVHRTPHGDPHILVKVMISYFLHPPENRFMCAWLAPNTTLSPLSWYSGNLQVTGGLVVVVGLGVVVTC